MSGLVKYAKDDSSITEKLFEWRKDYEWDKTSKGLQTNVDDVSPEQSSAVSWIEVKEKSISLFGITREVVLVKVQLKWSSIIGKGSARMAENLTRRGRENVWVVGKNCIEKYNECVQK